MEFRALGMNADKLARVSSLNGHDDGHSCHQSPHPHPQDHHQDHPPCQQMIRTKHVLRDSSSAQNSTRSNTCTLPSSQYPCDKHILNEYQYAKYADTENHDMVTPRHYLHSYEERCRGYYYSTDNNNNNNNNNREESTIQNENMRLCPLITQQCNDRESTYSPTNHGDCRGSFNLQPTPEATSHYQSFRQSMFKSNFKATTSSNDHRILTPSSKNNQCQKSPKEQYPAMNQPSKGMLNNLHLHNLQRNSTENSKHFDSNLYPSSGTLIPHERHGYEMNDNIDRTSPNHSNFSATSESSGYEILIDRLGAFNVIPQSNASSTYNGPQQQCINDLTNPTPHYERTSTIQDYRFALIDPVAATLLNTSQESESKSHQRSISEESGWSIDCSLDSVCSSTGIRCISDCLLDVKSEDEVATLYRPRPIAMTPSYQQTL